MTPTDDPGKAYPRGTFSKIAKRLGVTPQAVSLVAEGRSTSARISAELRREQRNAKRREHRMKGADAA